MNLLQVIVLCFKKQPKKSPKIRISNKAVERSSTFSSPNVSFLHVVTTVNDGLSSAAMLVKPTAFIFVLVEDAPS